MPVFFSFFPSVNASCGFRENSEENAGVIFAHSSYYQHLGIACITTAFMLSLLIPLNCYIKRKNPDLELDGFHVLNPIAPSDAVRKQKILFQIFSVQYIVTVQKISPL